MNRLDPLQSIVPILKGHRSKAITDVLGTGFFVGSPGSLYVISAKHVFEANPLKEGEHYAILFYGEKEHQLWNLKKVHLSSKFDIAACPIGELPRVVPLQFSAEEPALNDDIFTFEYSSTRFEKNPTTGKTNISFEPYSHKGNIVRSYNSLYPESIPTPSFLTSFPALQGASGAPVLFSSTGKNICITGMLIANIERHLLPAQVVRIEDEKGFVEETKYFLPFGKALQAKVIAQFLQDVGVENIFLTALTEKQ